ncbi:MAG: glycosyltransferase [Chitinivibrionales bacterium]|nr:glycosyltransferase [Chitinivibrionales bacterium]MBD3396327.1 glycosyltransferase [Chitinivibrionales bacterium]
MSSPSVSVILPVFNAEPFIGCALDSVLRSSLADIEVIVIDDGSTDHSADIAQKRAQTDARVRIKRFSRKGIANALNEGIALASSPVIARMDADDICDPRRFELQLACLRQNPDMAVVSCLVRPVSDASLSAGNRRYVEWVNQSISSEQIARDLYIESPLPHPSVMFRASAVRSLGGYRRYDGPEDYDLWLRMSDAGMKFCKVPAVLLLWRFHHANLTRSDPRYRKNAFLRRKIEHVARQVRRGRLAHGRKIRICGPGLAGKRLEQGLVEAGFPVEGFVDVNPARRSDTCSGLPVWNTAAVGKRDKNRFYFCAVRRWDSWPEIRRLFKERNKTEGIDYLIL